MNEARKYKTKKEFEKKNVSAFLAAHKYGFIKDMDWFPKFQRPSGYWKNKENVINEAKKYTTKTEFRKNAYPAYNAAKKNGYLEEITWPINPKSKNKIKLNNRHPKGYWKNRENMMREAKKYATKEEFKKGCQHLDG